jgi:hypothetical protein
LYNSIFDNVVFFVVFSSYTIFQFSPQILDSIPVTTEELLAAKQMFSSLKVEHNEISSTSNGRKWARRCK